MLTRFLACIGRGVGGLPPPSLRLGEGPSPDPPSPGAVLSGGDVAEVAQLFPELLGDLLGMGAVRQVGKALIDQAAQLGDLRRMAGGEVAGLAGIAGEIVELGAADRVAQRRLAGAAGDARGGKAVRVVHQLPVPLDDGMDAAGALFW